IVSGRIDLGVLWDTVELAALADKGARAFGGDPAELVEAAGRLASLPVVSAAASYDGSLQSMVALKRMTSELVGRFVTASVAGTRASVRALEEAARDAGVARERIVRADGPLGRYDADLAVPAGILAEVAML